MKKIVLLCGLTLLSGCKASERAQIFSLGSLHHVVCYSGNITIYDGESAGNVSNEEQSDGWYWKDTRTGKLVEATGPCMIFQE